MTNFEAFSLDLDLIANSLVIGGALTAGVLSLMRRRARPLPVAGHSRSGDAGDEVRLSDALDKLHLGFAVIGADGIVKSANYNYARMTGHASVDEIIGAHCRDWVVPELHDRVDAFLRSQVETTTNRETRYRMPDGTTRYLLGDASMRQSPEGREFVCLFRDVTLQRATESALQVRSRAIEASENGVVILSLEGGVHKITYVNTGFEALSGYTRVELVGMDIAKVYADSPHWPVLESMIKDAEPGQPARGIVNGLGRQGASAAISVTMTKLADTGTDLSYIIAVFRDMTETRRLAEISRLRDRAVDASQNGICIVDYLSADYPIVFWNAAFLRISGLSASAIPDRSARFLWERADKGASAVNFARAVRNGQSGKFTLRTKRDDGSSYWCDVFTDPVKDDNGRLTHCMIVLDDVTERREGEQRLVQIQKMDAIGQLTGGVAHDFNNLLTVVIGNVHLMLDQPNVEEANRKRLALALEAARRGSDLTQRLLAYARRQTLNTEIVSVNALINELVPLMERTLGENVRICTDLDPEAWICRVDSGQLENALINLAINARDAMPQGGELVITTENRRSAPNEMGPPKDGYVMITVTDTGIGMPAEIRDRVFEPFFTTKDVGKGTGLGLSMVYGFIKQSEGYIHIYSEPGNGTTVKLYLPRDVAGEKVKAPEKSCAPSAQGSGELILVVEDDAGVRATAVAILRKGGFRTIEATDGQEGLQILRQRSDIDLIFSDVIMPGGLSGLEFAEKAKSLVPGVPVLLASGYPREAIKQSHPAIQMPPLLIKPYDPAELVSMIKDQITSARGGSGKTLTTEPERLSA